jgi:hypothetical protein
VGHVGFDKVTSGKSSTETELTSQDGSRDYTGQLAGVLTGGGRVSATNTKQIQHRALGLENGTTADSSDLYGGHRHGDLKVTVVAADIVRMIEHEDETENRGLTLTSS